MTRRQRNELVARADLILACELDVEAYTVHFETQMLRGKVRKLLVNCYVHFARAGVVVLHGFDHAEIW
jgi:hypothetical protein